jgi:hypothetical protein
VSRQDKAFERYIAMRFPGRTRSSCQPEVPDTAVARLVGAAMGFGKTDPPAVGKPAGDDPPEEWLDARREQVKALEEQITALRQKLYNQAREITSLQEGNERRNRELDALHYVWCSGGCPGGVHRWTGEKITKELVEAAERNTRRLRSWYDTVGFRLNLKQNVPDWQQARWERTAAKTDWERFDAKDK